jgi:hypothetical protein
MVILLTIIELQNNRSQELIIDSNEETLPYYLFIKNSILPKYTAM